MKRRSVAIILTVLMLIPGMHWITAAAQTLPPRPSTLPQDPHGRSNESRQTQDGHDHPASGNVSKPSPAHPHPHDEEEKEEERHDEGGPDEGDHDHGEPETVTLTPQALQQAGIQVRTAEKGRISHAITLTGTVSVNEERTVHLSPKIEGVIREVVKGLGERTEAGDAVMILDSTQLGTAKVDFLRLFNEFETARIDRERRAQIRTNTDRLIEVLRQGVPPLEVEARTRDLTLGENRSRLLTAYSSVELTRTAHEREERLYKRKVSSQKEFLDARAAFEMAQAQYRGALDEVTYAIQAELLAADREFETRKAAYLAASQQLQVLGSSPEEIQALQEGRARDLNIFTVRSPIQGVITEKHGALGERVTPETTLATISDLGQLWVIGDAYEKDLAHVHPGMPAVVEVPSYPGQQFTGHVSMVSRVIDPKTRTVRVRVLVENSQNLLSIGMFATVKTTTGVEEAVLSVPIAAVQDVEGHPTIFVREAENRFRAQQVAIGARDAAQKRVEVYSGIQEGDPVVISGAFFLRSELARGEMGHDHAH